MFAYHSGAFDGSIAKAATTSGGRPITRPTRTSTTAVRLSLATRWRQAPHVESPVLRVRMLGALELRLDDARLPALDSARVESLLGYLLVHRQAPQLRQHLAFVLWPDSTEP